MALTRKLLESMGIEDKQIQAIIDAHDETINGLKAKRDEYKELAESVPDLQKQVEELREQVSEGESWEKKYEKEHESFEAFKEQVETEKTANAKAQAYKAMLTDAGIDPKRIEAVMRVTDLSGIEIEDGKLKDADNLKESAKKEWSDFVLKTKEEGSNPANPPKNSGGIDGADPEIEARMRERNERMFGKTETEE